MRYVQSVFQFKFFKFAEVRCSEISDPEIPAGLRSECTLVEGATTFTYRKFHLGRAK